jgi:hypothetical protein
VQHWGNWRVVNLPTPLNLATGSYILGGLDSATTPDPIKYEGFASMSTATDPTLTGGRLAIGQPFYAVGPTVQTTFGPTSPNGYLLVNGMELGPMLFINAPEPGSMVLAISGLTGLLIAGQRKRAWVKGTNEQNSRLTNC